MKTLRILFKEVNISQEEQLQGKILFSIESLRNTRAKQRMQISYAGLSFSGIAFVCAVFLYGGAFVQSEFWSVISLFFSDARVVVSYWNEFSLLLLETIPVIPILLMLVPTFIFLLFLSMYFKTREVHHYSY